MTSSRGTVIRAGSRSNDSAGVPQTRASHRDIIRLLRSGDPREGTSLPYQLDHGPRRSCRSQLRSTMGDFRLPRCYKIPLKHGRPANGERPGGRRRTLVRFVVLKLNEIWSSWARPEAKAKTTAAATTLKRRNCQRDDGIHPLRIA